MWDKHKGKLAGLLGRELTEEEEELEVCKNITFGVLK